MKKLSAFTFVSTLALASNSVLAYDDRDKQCETKYKDETIYVGTAACAVKVKDVYTNARSIQILSHTFYQVDNANQWEFIVKPGIHNLQQTHPIPRPGMPVGVLECRAKVPSEITQVKDGETCSWIPREPFVKFARYEFGACSGYTRLGYIDWDMVPGADSYEVVTNSGALIYQGSGNSTSFNSSSYGMKSLKVRAIEGSKVGSYQYFNASVPSCNPSEGDPVVPR